MEREGGNAETGSKSPEQHWVCEAPELPQGLLGDTHVPSENDPGDWSPPFWLIKMSTCISSSGRPLRVCLLGCEEEGRKFHAPHHQVARQAAPSGRLARARCPEPGPAELAASGGGPCLFISPPFLGCLRCLSEGRPTGAMDRGRRAPRGTGARGHMLLIPFHFCL